MAVNSELAELAVAVHEVELAVPKQHPLTQRETLRLQDLVDAPLIWFPRRASPALYDRLMDACHRGGLKSPRIIQEGFNEATILSLVSTGLGVGWVLGSARWRCPHSVSILPVADLQVAVRLTLAWRRDNTSPLLVRFVSEARRLAEVQAASDGAIVTPAHAA